MLSDFKLFPSLNNKKCTPLKYSRKLIDKDVFNNAVLSKLIKIETAFKSIFESPMNNTNPIKIK